MSGLRTPLALERKFTDDDGQLMAARIDSEGVTAAMLHVTPYSQPVG